MMKLSILVDTNILIPLDPLSEREFSEKNSAVALLVRTIQETGATLYVHPATRYDINRDSDENRRKKRLTLISKYAELVLPERPIELPKLSRPSSAEFTNDWVDNELLKVVYANLVNLLVTEDRGLHRKANEIGLGSRVLYIDEAVEYLSKFFVIIPPRQSDAEFVHPLDIDLADRFFISLSFDYPEFFDWYRTKVIPDQSRRVLVAREKEHDTLAALAILKPEDSVEYGPKGKTLKICTFKVFEEHGRRRFGELLLKNILLFCKRNAFEFTYVTVFKKHGSLIDFLGTFGFEETGFKPNGEIVLSKRLVYTPEEYNTLDSLTFNIRFGPFICNRGFRNSFIVPIVPQYHRLLFPDVEEQMGLFNNQPSGNSIRKSYISHSNSRKVESGDLLFFYGSRELGKAIYCAGIVEEAKHISELEELVSFVGNRTVFGLQALSEMIGDGVLCLNFRLLATYRPGVPIGSLIEKGALVSYPQSITELKRGKTEWLMNALGI